MNKHFLVILFSFFTASLFAQDLDSLDVADTILTSDDRYMFIVEGDSIAIDAIPLNEVIIVDKIKFKDKQKLRKYLILKRKTRKVYPYAKMASDTLSKIVADLQDYKKKRHKRKYIKKMQRFMEDRFTKELKKLTRTEGQILVKLIHRQTGENMYNLIKEYRSGFKAFVYDKTAALFDISLKKEFQPITEYEDYLIEDILQRSFLDGILEEQPPAKSLGYNFLELTDKWKERLRTTTVENDN